MAIKEVYRFKGPLPFRGITESKFDPINCDRCTVLTVKISSNQLYCQPCGAEVKREQTRKSHSTPEARQKNIERNRQRRRLEKLKRGVRKQELKKEIVAMQSPVLLKPSPEEEKLQKELVRLSQKIDSPIVVFRFGKSEIPIEFSPGDNVKKEPHFHIRQGNAEYPMSARDVGEAYGYSSVSKAVKKLSSKSKS